MGFSATIYGGSACKARIKNIHQDKGFGFIECDVLKQQGFEQDVFLRHSPGGRKKISEGDVVTFKAVLRGQQLYAKDVAMASKDNNVWEVTPPGLGGEGENVQISKDSSLQCSTRATSWYP
ncbi:unnamed protein product [Symbiodinium sp. CCMP2592]|nr:unnamed protein product [Symbiodinium sp. CCMP2592]